MSDPALVDPEASPAGVAGPTAVALRSLSAAFVTDDMTSLFGYTTTTGEQ